MQPGVTLIGPVSRDIIRIGNMPERRQPGGTVFYAGMALRALDVPVSIITRLAPEDETELLAPLRQAGAVIDVLPSAQTSCFINRYGPGPDQRTQQVTMRAAPFTSAHLPAIVTQWVYLAPLLQGDIPTELIEHLARSGRHRIALDAQGWLRHVINGAVIASQWPEGFKALPWVDILKADADEAAIITGQRDPEMAARILCGRGADHVLVTLGEQGSVLCHRGALVRQPAYRPAGGDFTIMDTTGCGDTFLAAYLSRIILGEAMPAAGRFAAVAAALKQTHFGPLQAGAEEILQMLPSGSDSL
jgi:sugar/nucleoside kinase (ribokinase family)